MFRHAFVFTALFFTFTAFADPAAEQIQKESYYDGYVRSIGNMPLLLPFFLSKAEDTKLFTDALWDVVTVEKNKTVQSMISGLSTDRLALADRVRFQILSAWPQKAVLSQDLQKEINDLSRSRTLDRRTLYLLFSYAEQIEIPSALTRQLEKQNAEALAPLVAAEKAFRVKTKEEIKDLYFNSPELGDVADGRYKNGIRVFMFCRSNRAYPCLFLMKDRNNQPVYESEGKLWHQPALGFSKLGLPYNQRNGHTPSGVLTIDSVMPTPEPTEVFGQFRRFILNFVAKSENEAENRKFLPATAQTADWWKEANVARDVGRDLLRVHGSGKLPDDPSAPNWPLRPTLGCIMQREGKVGRVTYKDQRRLLDTSMEALGLEKIYNNETAITGVLYLIDLDTKKKAVTYEDIQEYLDL